MQSKKRITINDLINFLSTTPEENSVDDTLFTKSDQPLKEIRKSNYIDTNIFKTLKYTEKKSLIDFPKKIKHIFDPFITEMERHGIKKQLGTETNLSLFFSILYCIMPEYKTFDKELQLLYIKKLRDKLTVLVMNNFTYKHFGWNKKDLLLSLSEFKTNKMILKLITDYFNINIILLNISEDKIYIVSADEGYNMFRQNIIVTFFESTFEPIFHSESGIYCFSSPSINKMISVHKTALLLLNLDLSNQGDKPFQFVLETRKIIESSNDKIREEIKEEENKEKVKKCTVNEYTEEPLEDSDSDLYADLKDIEDTLTEPDPENIIKPVSYPLLVFKVSDKMKLAEIQQIASKLNIILDKKGKVKQIPKTKTELIAEINKLNA
jgi:hypothetical protein